MFAPRCFFVTPQGRVVWTAPAARVLAEFERQRVSLAAPLPAAAPQPAPLRPTHSAPEVHQ